MNILDFKRLHCCCEKPLQAFAIFLTRFFKKRFARIATTIFLWNPDRFLQRSLIWWPGFTSSFCREELRLGFLQEPSRILPTSSSAGLMAFLRSVHLIAACASKKWATSCSAGATTCASAPSAKVVCCNRPCSRVSCSDIRSFCCAPSATASTTRMTSTRSSTTSSSLASFFWSLSLLLPLLFIIISKPQTCAYIN